MPKYKIADVIFQAKPIYAYSVRLCASYLYDGDEPAEFSVETTKEDIVAERERGGAEGYPDAYLESLALFRKLCDYLLCNKQDIVFHSSAIAVDGKAYLFTAPSGTGKSTHARLWRELLGDRAVMINDDKPIIRYVDGDFYVYGTPWNGKHHLDTNARAKIEAICELRRGKENFISAISPAEMLLVVMNQTIRPEDAGLMEKLLILIDKLLTSVKLYRLNCNVSAEAAKLSFGTMSGEKI